jgi:hypothetical protein
MMPDSSRCKWVDGLSGVHAFMLYAYPKAFRIRFGGEMQQVFRERCRAAARDNELPVFVLRAFRDWLGASIRERLAAMRNPEVHAMQPLVAGWWLLALGSIAEAMCAAMHIPMQNMMLNPYNSARLFPLATGAVVISAFALIAGTCAIAAGAWNFRRGDAWLLSLHGLTLGASFGLIGLSTLVKGHLGFRAVSLLFVAMAVSAGAFALRSARAPHPGAADRWFLNLSGAASFAFAVSFAVWPWRRVGVVGFRWVSPSAYWVWMASYFALCSVFMVYLALRVRSRRWAEC